MAGSSGYYDRRARAAIVRAYRHALVRLGETVLRLMLLHGLERARVELEHLQVWVEDVQQEDGGIKSADRSRVSADKLESRREGRRVSGADIWSVRLGASRSGEG